jgi:hypothetical protein
MQGGRHLWVSRSASSNLSSSTTMVIVLDALFCHRSRTMEGKDGSPLNEVRVLCNSLMFHDGRLRADKSIKLSPAASVLKLQVGDEIRLNENDFRALGDASFAEIEATSV